MENACTDCYGLVLHNKPHSALKKISELKGSELYKCCNCYAYLHKHDSEWEIISGGDFMGSPEGNRKEPTNESNQRAASGHLSYQL
jgi:hypothetical protein